jgi:hypothetical protein
MVDHQHMGAVGVEHPRPHDELTEIVVADRFPRVAVAVAAVVRHG